MSLLKVLILAIVQGLAELLPVSSSAHVVVAEKLLGLDPSSPPLTLLLVMLHTGTMAAVIVYFWPRWRATYFCSALVLKRFLRHVVIATALTAIIGGGAIKIIATTVFRDRPHAEIEDLFGHLEFIAPALGVAGILILIAGLLANRQSPRALPEANGVNDTKAALIGAIQGLCLPFRGFSRSGATISLGMLLGVAKAHAENFSFALAVVLTPAVIVREVLRLIHSTASDGIANLDSVVFPSLLGAAVAYLAGLLALKWLSRWLEGGRWHLFGLYCLLAAVSVAALHRAGY